MMEIKIGEKVDICPDCEKCCNIEIIESEYEAEIFGETHIIKSQFFRCTRCGAEFFNGEQLNNTIVDGEFFIRNMNRRF